MISASKQTAFIIAVLGAISSARAADGANGQNGNGAGASTIDNRTPLTGTDGGNGTDGGKGGNGGIGAWVTGSGSSNNTSSINGGGGGRGGSTEDRAGGSGGNGGAGVYFANGSATFVNSGVITGGAGGAGATAFLGGGPGGDGGAAAYFAGNGATFANSGTVTGAAGGDGGNGGDRSGDGATGGAGAYFAGLGATFVNSGVVAGGAGGGGGSGFVNSRPGSTGGAGAYFASPGAMFVNSGVVSGGAGGESGASFLLSNFPPGGSGGAGAYFGGSEARFLNSGAVTGGAGGRGAYGGYGGMGGAGVQVDGLGATFVNQGTLAGGAGGDTWESSHASAGSGGSGADFAGLGARFDNRGLIKGGMGGKGLDNLYPGSSGGIGGTGVHFAHSGAILANSGVVTGGAGGKGSSVDLFKGKDGGAGGAGVYFAGKGAMFINSGAVSGGAGGLGGKGGAIGGDGATGLGGAGVIGDGLTLVNGGTIAGGLSGDGKTRATAIVFNSGANVLESLAGSRIIGGVDVNGASLALKGAATVQGDLTFKPGSIFIAQMGGAGASHFDLSGVARLDGTLIATAAFTPGSLLMRNYSIIHAAGGFANTRFATTQLNLSSLPPSLLSNGLSYGASDVFLNFTSTLGAGALLNQNQQAVAAAINNGFNAGGVVSGRLSNLYWLNGGALPGALTMTSGEAATGAQQTAFRATEQFLAAMLDPTAAGRDAGSETAGPALAFGSERAPMPGNVQGAYASVPQSPAFLAPAVYQPRWTSWASAFGGYNRLGGDPTGAGSHTLSGGSFGVAGGFDYHVSQDTLLGAALAGGGTNWGLSEGLGGGGSSVLHAGAYGSTRMGPAYLSGAFAFANQWMTTGRAAAFGDALSARFAAQTYGGRVEGGYRLATPIGGLTPYAAVQTQSFVTPGYAETGALVGGFGLAYQGRAAWDTRTELGAKLDRLVTLEPGLALALRGRLAWAHDWVSDPTLLATFQTLPGAAFLVEGALPVKNTALVSSGAELRFADGATLSARFDGGFAPRGQSYAGTVGLRYSW